MKRYFVTCLVLALVALIFIGYPQGFTRSGFSAGQRRGTRTRTSPATPKRPGIDYSTFSHATKSTKALATLAIKYRRKTGRRSESFLTYLTFLITTLASAAIELSFSRALNRLSAGIAIQKLRRVTKRVTAFAIRAVHSSSRSNSRMTSIRT